MAAADAGQSGVEPRQRFATVEDDEKEAKSIIFT